MATVGSAKIEFEADASGVSSELEAQLDQAMSNIEGILNQLTSNVEAGAQRAGDAVGGDISDGARQADAALSGVDGGGMAAASQAASQAGASVASEFLDGSSQADSALSGVDGNGMSGATSAASSASSAVSGAMQEAASYADAALSGVDGNGFAGATSSATSSSGSVRDSFADAAAEASAALTGVDGDGFVSATSSANSSATSMRDVMSQAAADVQSSWNTATESISDGWAQTEGQATQTFGSGFAGKIAGGTAALGGLVGATGAVTSAFEKQTSIEDTTAVLEVLTGNADVARQTMDDLVESNLNTPVNFDQWAQAGQTLVAFGAETDEVSGIVTALGEAAWASGDGAEGLDRLSRAFGQSMATGSLNNETIMQLAESGVPALDILANHYGVTAEEMQSMASEGLPAEEAIRVLTDGIMDGTDGVAGSTAAFSGTMETLSGTTSGVMGNLGSAFTNVTSTAIEPLIEALKGFGEWLTEALYAVEDFITWLREGSPAAQVFIGVITGIASAILIFMIPAMVKQGTQAAIMAAKNVAAWFSVRMAAWTAEKGSVKSIAIQIGNWIRLGAVALAQGARIALGWVIAMGPIGWIIGAIAGIGLAFVALWNNSEGFRNFWIGLWDTIKNAVSSAWLWIQETWAAYGQPVVDWIVGAFQRMGDFLGLVFRLIGAAWEVFTTALGKAWNAWGQPVVDWVVRAFQWAWGNLQTVFGWIQGAWNGLWNWVSGIWDQYGQPIVDAVVGAFERLRARIDGVLWNIRNYIDMAGHKIRSLWDEYVQPMVDWVTNGFNDLLDTIKGWKDNVIGWFSDAGTWLFDAGKNIVQGIIDGVKSMGKWVRDAFLNILPDWVKDPFKEALEIESPSKVFAGYGRNIGEGLIEGVNGMQGQVRAATQGLADSAAAVSIPVAPATSGTAPVAPASGDMSATVDTSAWQGMGATIADTRASVIDPAMVGIQEGTVATAGTFNTQLGGVASPAVEGMGANLLRVKAGVIDPALMGIDAGVQGTASQFYNGVYGTINPAVQGMGTNLAATKTGVIDPEIAGIRSGVYGMATQLQHNVNDNINPNVRNMGANLALTRTGVIDPALYGIQTGIYNTATQFHSNINDSINPNMQWMGSNIQAVKVGAIDPAFEGLKTGMQSVADAFGLGARNVGIHMENMRILTQDPVRFTINRVFADGLVDVWNDTADMIGEKTIVKKYASFATGGVMDGAAYSPGRDNIRMYDPVGGHVLDLSGHESVMRPEFTRAVGTDTVNGLNAAARSGGVEGVGRYFEHLGAFNQGGVIGGGAGGGKYLGGYRPGGVMYGGNFGGLSPVTASHASWVGKHFPDIFTLTSANRYTDSGHHSTGKASDWSNGGAAGTPQMKALARAMGATFPGAAELIHWPLAGWQNISEGQPFNFGAATNNDHRDHVHFATHSPLGAGAGLDGVGINWNVDYGAMVRRMAQPKLDSIQSEIDGTNFPGYVGGIPQGTYDYMREPMLDKMATSMEEAYKNIGGGSGAERWRPLAMQALARHGYNPNEHIDAMLQQIQIESNGDPGAINRWDSNWLRGTPSGGLLQVIQPTYDRIRRSYPEAFEGLPDDMLFPLTNLTAGVGAVRQDWGGPAGRWPTRDGYHLGGLMPEGPGMFEKTAIAPERVLSPRQTGAFERLVDDVIDRQDGGMVTPTPTGSGGDYSGGRIIREVHVTQNIHGDDAKRTAETIENRLMKLV